MCVDFTFYKRSGLILCQFSLFSSEERKRGPGNEVGEIQDGGSNDVTWHHMSSQATAIIVTCGVLMVSGHDITNHTVQCLLPVQTYGGSITLHVLKPAIPVRDQIFLYPFTSTYFSSCRYAFCFTFPTPFLLLFYIRCDRPPFWILSAPYGNGPYYSYISRLFTPAVGFRVCQYPNDHTFRFMSKLWVRSKDVFRPCSRSCDLWSCRAIDRRIRS